MGFGFEKFAKFENQFVGIDVPIYWSSRFGSNSNFRGMYSEFIVAKAEISGYCEREAVETR